MTAQPAAAGAAPERVGRRFVVLMACLALSSLGNGLCFPFTSIYISQLLGLGSGGTGGYFIAMAAASFAAALLGGPLADRAGPHKVAALGGTALGVGYAMLAPAHGAPLVLASGACVGVGFGLFYAAVVGVVDAAVPERLRRTAFTVRHIVNNVGIGAGSVLAGLALHGADTPTATLRWLYVANAAAALPLVAVVWAVRPRGGRNVVPRAADGGGDSPTYRTLLRSGPMALLVLAQALFAIVGFTQIEATVPLLMHDRMAVTLGWVSAVVAANSFALVALQPLARRWFERLPETVSLAVGPVLWAAAFGCGLLAAVLGDGGDGSGGSDNGGGPAVRYGLLLAFAVLFAAGELTYSSAYYPLLLRWSGEAAVGRASALASLAWNLGTASGPPLGLFVIGHTPAAGSWLALAAGAGAAFAVAAALHRRAAAHVE
ncbi:MFS transporter [Streptomyces sp. XD-27]|uniref:MFS transporter n=1 Tax=Streptomyces sp. XD-27 TaxID=3062779 RepID=UPI0026F41346|nr:MFS transporter [Streptomyces sp. XD-27]WKX70541.1 MFS transporter [Streptomyces sp. XD-27]